MDEKPILTKKINSVSALIKKNFENSEFIKNNPEMTTLKGHVLGYVKRRHKQGQTVYQKDIEKDFSIGKSTASEILNLLEQGGYIVRTPDPVDGRKKAIELTPVTEELMAHLVATFRELNAKMLSDLTDEQISFLDTILDQIIINLKGDSLC